jgi:hypothetical protein
MVRIPLYFDLGKIIDIVDIYLYVILNLISCECFKQLI